MSESEELVIGKARQVKQGFARIQSIIDDRLMPYIAALEAENERLRAALEWYADDSNWTAADPYPNSVAEQDEGARAKAALNRAQRGEQGKGA